jgi:hypothetical protein
MAWLPSTSVQRTDTRSFAHITERVTLSAISDEVSIMAHSECVREVDDPTVMFVGSHMGELG